MRLPVVAALGSALVLAFSTPALAYPVDEPELTNHPLYNYGKLPESECLEKPVTPNDATAARAYLRGVFDCLDSTWGQYLAANGAYSRPIKLTFAKKIPKKWCGMTTHMSNSQWWYCADTHTVVFQLGRDWLDEPRDLWLFMQAGTVYGLHVANLVGIGDAYGRTPHRSKAELREQTRRKYLQITCLAGAFIKSVWPLKDRGSSDLNQLYRMFVDDQNYGKGKSQRYWTKEGFLTGDPGSCNTWASTSSRVA
ncbi:hypothetical protein ACIBH1_16915 [Nonomuraea sp. NPDC050663]|uniref:hypothetical protein n=1 Tax=Nonomuraea sp. NPDC050663 TaxID=3364370 RepID=UPI00379FB7D6